MPDKFENQLRDRLEDHSSEVDTLAIWEAVEERLEKKKRRAIIWWLPALLLVIISGLLWSKSFVTEKFSSDDLTAFPLPTEVVLTNVAEDESQFQKAREDHCGSSENQFAEDGYQSSQVFGEAGFEVTNDQKPKPLSKGKDEQFENLVQPAKTEVRKTVLNALELTETPTEVLTVSQKEELTKPPSNSIEATLPKQESLGSFDAIPALDPALLSLPDQELLDRKDQLRLNRLAKNNAETNFKMANRPYWSLALEQVASYPMSKHLADNLEANIQAERNEATVTNLESFSSSLLVGFHLSRHWSLRGGLSYRRINSRTDHQTSKTEEFIDPDGIVSIRVDAAGDSTFVTGPVSSIRTTNGQFRYYNSKTTFDLPVLLGYEFGKKRLRFALEAGPVINLAAISKATLLGAEDQLFEASNDNGWFRNRLSGLGWVAGMKMGYQVTPKTRISLGLRYERTPSSGFETETAGYRTRYDLLGVGLGVSRKF